MRLFKNKRILSLMLVLLMFLSVLPVSANEPINVERLAGSNRYETSLRASKSAFEKSDYAIIASGENFPDALVGGVLAGVIEAPLLVTSKSNVSKELLSELNRLEVKKVYLLGGENTLTQDVENALSDYEVERISGNNRYETANEVSKVIETHLGEISNTYFADGRNFPDALAVAPLVAKNNGVLMLNDGSPISTGIAVGGVNSVPGDVQRIAGTNRMDTAVNIANQYQDVSKVIIVDAGNYPDALSASSLSHKYNAPILLTSSAKLSIEAKEYIKNNSVKDVIIIGGTNSVSEKIVDELIGRTDDEKPVEPVEPTPDQEKELYKVIRVIDGDTLVININNVDEKVRLIGVDTPESVHPDPNRNSECGKIASDFTKSKLEGKMVELELDVQERDKYGRVLAYVYLDGVMFNKTLLSAGMAKIATYPPNTKYVDDFVELQRVARENNIGLWGSDCNHNKPEPEPNPNPGVTGELPYIGNKNSKIFHYSNCGSIKVMSPHNKIVIETRDEAISMNYKPCNRCKP